jgi:transposase
MIRLKLSKQKTVQLKRLLEINTHNKNFHNIVKIQAILAVNNGHNCKVVSEIINYSIDTIYEWIADFLIRGIDFLKTKKKTGRPSKLSVKDQAILKKMISDGPEKTGFDGGCWRTPMIQHLIKKTFGVDISVKYLPEFLEHIGLSYQKAKFVSGHKDPIKREQWLQEVWPKIIQLQQVKKAMVLFGDEASFPQWGSLSYTWAPRGKQPVVKHQARERGIKSLVL